MAYRLTASSHYIYVAGELLRTPHTYGAAFACWFWPNWNQNDNARHILAATSGGLGGMVVTIQKTASGTLGAHAEYFGTTYNSFYIPSSHYTLTQSAWNSFIMPLDITGPAYVNGNSVGPGANTNISLALQSGFIIGNNYTKTVTFDGMIAHVAFGSPRGTTFESLSIGSAHGLAWHQGAAPHEVFYPTSYSHWLPLLGLTSPEPNWGRAPAVSSLTYPASVSAGVEAAPYENPPMRLFGRRHWAATQAFSVYVQPAAPSQTYERQVFDLLGVDDQRRRSWAENDFRDNRYDTVGLEDSNFPLMRHTIKWWQRLYIEDTIVGTHIIIPVTPPPTEVSTTYTRQYTDTLELFDQWLDFVNNARLRRITDTLPVRDSWLRPRNYSYSIQDNLTLTDSFNDLGHVWYTGYGQVLVTGLADTWRDINFNGFGLVELSQAADTWRDYGMDGYGVVGLVAPSIYRQVELTITGVPDGWAARVKLPDNTVAAVAPSSMGRVVLELDIPDILTSGTLDIFVNSAATIGAPFGRIPLSGNNTFKRSNIWGYRASPYFLTHTAESMYIDRPYGGWTSPGSLRMEREEMGFTTFTDSALNGLTRGAYATIATSHNASPSDVVILVKSGTGLLDITSHLSYVNSTRWLQDQIQIFANSKDELYIGASSRFSAVHFWLARNATQQLYLSPYYSAGDSAWINWNSSAMIAPFDMTSGFTWSGQVNLEPPGDWDQMPILDATSRYWFKLIRQTGSSAVIPPCLMGVTLTGDVVVTKRINLPFTYKITAADSGQMLYFKAMARGLVGTVVDGTHAPVAAVDLRL